MIEGGQHVPQYPSEQQQQQALANQQLEQPAFQTGIQQHPGNGGPTPEATYQNEQVRMLFHIILGQIMLLDLK